MVNKLLIVCSALFVTVVHSFKVYPETSVGTAYYPGRYNPSSTQDCGGVINTSEGWIFTPNYPANYENSIVCTYTVQRFSPDVCKVELHFIDFDLEDTSPACDGDYLDLGQGYRMCGLLISDTRKTIEFPTGQPILQFKFRSNSERNRKGFMAKVTQVANSCSSYNPWKPNQSPYDGDVIHSFQDNCDTYITGLGGIIRSPEYPRNYPTNRLCLYVIKRPNNNVCRVELMLKNFDVEQNLYSGSTQCENDYLELPGRVKLCGYRNDRRVVNYTPGSDYVVLTFKSDAVGTAPGFEIDVRQIPNSCDIFQSPRTYKCDATVETENARIQSPRFPGFYGSNEQCTYFVKKLGYNTCYFTMDFITFNTDSTTDSSGQCSNDFMQLADGTRICGNIAGKRTFVFPRENDRYPMFFFSSDGYGEGRGYDIIIQQLPCGVSTPYPPYPTKPGGGGSPLPCDRIISRDETISSPDYPSDYSPLTRCIYTIYKSDPDVCEVKLQFLHFDVEKTSGCRADSFLIEPTGEKLCGRDVIKPERIVKFPYASSQMRLIFSSDSQVQRPGFELKLQQLRNSCGRPFDPAKEPEPTRVCESSSSLVSIFRSYNYPMPYSSNINCIYKVYRANSRICALEIYFSDFSVGTWENKYCINDYVEIDGIKYCGNRRGERLTVAFPHYIDSVNMRFKTDAYDNYGGFRIEVKQTSNNCNLPPKQPKPLPICDEIHVQPSFTVSSPNYGLRNYDDYTDCHYTIKKSSFDVCALEITFKRFDIEESVDCVKDYLEISTIKICGKLPYNSKRTHEFTADETVMKFHTDGAVTASGFSANIRQVKC